MLVDEPLARAAQAAGGVRQEVFFEERPRPAVAGDHQARRREEMAEARRRDARRHHRQAPRPAYRAGDRTGMEKIKNYRSADCVVGGFRYNEGKPWSARCCSGSTTTTASSTTSASPRSIAREDKPALTKKLEKLIAPPGFTGNAPGGPSRWSTERSAEWQPLKPKLVVEVGYDHFSGDRFRHGTRLMRWRPDKSPKQCTMDQVDAEESGPDEAAEIIITPAACRSAPALRRRDRASR